MPSDESKNTNETHQSPDRPSGSRDSDHAKVPDDEVIAPGPVKLADLTARALPQDSSPLPPDRGLSAAAQLARLAAAPPRLSMGLPRSVLDSFTPKLSPLTHPTLSLLEPQKTLSAQLAASLSTRTLPGSNLSAFDIARATGLSTQIQEWQGSITAFSRTMRETREGLTAFGSRYDSIFKLASSKIDDPIREALRRCQWMGSIGGMTSSDIAALSLRSRPLEDELSSIRKAMDGSFIRKISEDQDRFRSMLGFGDQIAAGMGPARMKLSILAGVTETFGTNGVAHRDAYRSLFGTWHTHPNLPEPFWQDATVRKQMYIEAEVDAGLVDADVDTALEAVVESGLTAGFRSDEGITSQIVIGNVPVEIRGNDTRGDAYKVVEAVEARLRQFVTSKLTERFGPKWFRQRVDGKVVTDVRRIREQALRQGEAARPIVEYTEIGSLVSIISAKNNWEEVFGDIFANKERFRFDMETVISTRRPIMHGRPIEPLQLMELICVVHRLMNQIEGDGDWKVAAEADE